MLLDVRTRAELVDRTMWAEDRVHLNSAGHRTLAYAAARVLGVPDATELGALERAVHDDDASRRPPRRRRGVARQARGAVAAQAPARTCGRRRPRPEAARTRARARCRPTRTREARVGADDVGRGSARLAAELALVVDRTLRVLGAAAAVEVGLALALLRGLVLAVEGLAELALRLLGGARGCSARRKSCLRVCHGCGGRGSRAGAAAAPLAHATSAVHRAKTPALLGWDRSPDGLPLFEVPQRGSTRSASRTAQLHIEHRAHSSTGAGRQEAGPLWWITNRNANGGLLLVASVSVSPDAFRNACSCS